MKIKEAAKSIGKRVQYKDETGIIVSVNTIWVFVRYDTQHYHAEPMATSPEDLVFL